MNKAKSTTRQIPRISLTPDEASLSTGLSRTRIFGAIRDRRLLARGEGKATIIEIAELARWVRSLPPKGRAVDTATPTSMAANACEIESPWHGDGDTE